MVDAGELLLGPAREAFLAELPAIVSGLRGYVPPLRGCLARIAVRIVSWVLIAFQPIPLVGAVILPTMCLATYAIYRHALLGRARADLPQLAPAS